MNIYKSLLTVFSDDFWFVFDKENNVIFSSHPIFNYEDFDKVKDTDNFYYNSKNNEWYDKIVKEAAYDDNGVLKMITVVKFTCATKYKEKELKSYLDDKTGLLNSSSFENQLLHLTSGENNYFISFIDLDDFKSINDIYGHNIGDRVIRDIATILKKRLKINDIAGRFGGDEFIVAIKSDSTSDVERLLNTIRNDIVNIRINKISNVCSASIGFTVYDKNISFINNLEKADKALYVSKNKGKNTITFN